MSSSSSSSSSSALSSASASKMSTSTRSKSSRLSLYIHPRPLRFPFVGEWFTIGLYCVDASNTLRTDVSALVNAKLFDETGEDIDKHNERDVMKTEPPNPIAIAATRNTDANTSTAIVGAAGVGGGHCDVRVRLNATSLSLRNRAVFIRFSAVGSERGGGGGAGAGAADGDGDDGGLISAVSTPLMTVVRYQLRIVSEPPAVWYKDEGGRDKTMTIKANVVDANGAAVCSRQIPLTVTLCYATDGAPTAGSATDVVDAIDNAVKNQSILKLPTDAAPAIDQADGAVTLKLRIEDVSKNHQKQSFAIRIAPDTSQSPLNADISPVVTQPITVLSKRNKRRRVNEQRSIHLSTPFHSKDVRDPPPASPSSRAPMDTDSAANDSVLMSSAVPSDPSAQVIAIREWSRALVSGLCAMEWQHIGFEITESGQVHLHRPIHRCPACWTYKDAIRPQTHAHNCIIATALARYHHDVLPAIKTLERSTITEAAVQRAGDDAAYQPPNDPPVLQPTHSFEALFLNTNPQANVNAMMPTQPQHSEIAAARADEWSAASADLVDVVLSDPSPFGNACFASNGRLIGFVNDVRGSVRYDAIDDYLDDDGNKRYGNAYNHEAPLAHATAEQINEARTLWTKRYHNMINTADDGNNKLLRRRNFYSFEQLAEQAILDQYAQTV